MADAVGGPGPSPVAGGWVEDGAVWEGRSVSVGDVLRALGALRRQREAAVRTSVLTLVVPLAGRGDAGADTETRGGGAEAVLSALHRLGGRHPSRTVVVRVGAGEPGLDARVGVHELVRGGARLVLDDVVLEARGPVGRRLDSLVEPFIVPDLPVVVWERGPVPAPEEPLVSTADAVVVDSAGRAGGADTAGRAGGAGGDEALAAAARLARVRPLVDLAWLRLTPLRQRLADLLRSPAFAPCLDALESAEVRARGVERGLLGGWLADRLGLPPDRLHRLDPRAGELAAMILRARPGGRGGRVEALRDGRGLVAEASLEGGPHTRSAVAPPPDDDVTLLGAALLRLRPDPVYEGSLAAAATLP